MWPGWVSRAASVTAFSSVRSVVPHTTSRPSINFSVIAATDVPFQLWSHFRKLRMTRQEIKDELKETEGNPEMRALIRDGLLDWIQAPTVDEPAGSADASEASNHGAFDDDAATLCATVTRILDIPRTESGAVDIHRSSAGLDERRRRLYRAICETP